MVKRTVISIGIAFSLFCVTGVVFDLIYHGNFSLEHYGYTKMTAGCVLLGLGFGAPSAVYQKESLPRPIQVIVHMGTGCAVYTAVAFWVGWVPAARGVLSCLPYLAGQLAAAFVIWLLFVRYYKAEAEKINERINASK